MFPSFFDDVPQDFERRFSVLGIGASHTSSASRHSVLRDAPLGPNILFACCCFPPRFNNISAITLLWPTIKQFQKSRVSFCRESLGRKLLPKVRHHS